MTNITDLKEKLTSKTQIESFSFEYIISQKDFQKSYNRHFVTIETYDKTITALLSIIEDMQKGLKFYGNMKSWNDSFDSENRVSVIDILDVSKTDYPKNKNAKFGGKRARQTLTATEQKLKEL